MSIIDIFKLKCPKCKSTKITTIREGFFAKFRRYMTYVLLFITLLFVRAPKDQYICQECGFTWFAK